MPRLSREIEDAARALAAHIRDTWRAAIEAIVSRWLALHRERRLDPHTARVAAQSVLSAWPAVTASLNADVIDQMFQTAFDLGALDTAIAIQPDRGDQAVVEWLKRNERGFIPALQDMAAENLRVIEQIIADAYAGKAPFDLDDMVQRLVDRIPIGARRAELIVRTETAKASALGRLMAWENDPYRDYYDYWWIATPDDRTKDVSLLFEREGPYTWSDIYRRWTVDHNRPILVRNRHTGQLEHQVSAFNCRCTVARTPKEPRDLLAEGKITPAEFEAMERL